MLGKSRSYVQNALKNPSLKTLQSIADVLEVDIRDLFAPEKNKTTSELVQDLKETINRLEDKL